MAAVYPAGPLPMMRHLVCVLVILYSTLGVLGVFLGDILMVILDPRIRLTEKEEG